jgi:hypothetical protein
MLPAAETLVMGALGPRAEPREVAHTMTSPSVEVPKDAKRDTQEDTCCT